MSGMTTPVIGGPSQCRLQVVDYAVQVEPGRRLGEEVAQELDEDLQAGRVGNPCGDPAVAPPRGSRTVHTGRRMSAPSPLSCRPRRSTLGKYLLPGSGRRA